MLRKILVLFFLFAFVKFHAQNNQSWRGYFSYNSIKDVTSSGERIIAAAENAIFSKNTITNEIKKYTTVEGLSGDPITQIHYSDTYKKIIIGHSNGLLIIINENDGSVLNVVDIVNKQDILSNQKKINHFTEHNGKLYISTDYGISVLNLQNSEFGDSYYIGSGGSKVKVLQTTVFNDIIYAVVEGYGLLSALSTNPFLIDYNQWLMKQSGNWKAVEATQNKISLLSESGVLYELTQSNTLINLETYSQLPLDFKYKNGELIVTTGSVWYVYDNNLIKTSQINNSFLTTAQFTTGISTATKYYIGSNLDGLIEVSKTNSSDFNLLSPEGPLRNKIFGLKTNSLGFWAVYGEYDSRLTPLRNNYGVSRFKFDKWSHISFTDLLGAQSIISVTNNPQNENDFYLSSFCSGLLNIKNDVPNVLYNSSNSSMQPIPNFTPADFRVGVSNFDRSNNLWTTTAFTDNQLHVLRTNGSWQSYKMNCVDAGLVINAKGVIIDKNETKWIYSRIGAIGFNEKTNKCIYIKEGVGNGNLPIRDVRIIAADKNNKLWLGTPLGLRILPSVDSFLTQDKLETNQIIILEDGVPQELLYQIFISEIVVDGANNKWIGTAGNGIYYLNDDGQKTFYHFTKDNSPLPSDFIIDIEIDERSGEVFFVTEGGTVSFKGNATSGAEDLQNVVVFPNPVRPSFNGSVSITGLMDNCNVKITDIEGNLVHEAISEGGTVMWDTTVFGKRKVASGVYIVHISAEDGIETEVKKIMIIR